MPSPPLLVLVAYDIADDRRREQLASLLAAWGARVQFSVFECDLPDQAAYAKLLGAMAVLIDDNEDQVRCYRLPKATRSPGPATILGNRRLEERMDFHII